MRWKGRKNECMQCFIGSLIIRFLWLVIVMAVGVQGLLSQVVQPTAWEFSLHPIAGKAKEAVVFRAQVRIESGWYLYSSNFDSTLGPKVTEFIFEEHASYRKVGGLKPIGFKKGYDSIFEGDYTYFLDSALFEQVLRVEALPYRVSGTVDYQVCAIADGRCVSLSEDFVLGDLSFSQGQESLPMVGTQTRGVPHSLWGFFWVAFLAGFVALLTPCVFPLIPMTVTYFSQTEGRYKAVLYGVCIVLIYTLIGVVLAPFMGPATANALATHWFPNVLFFLVFVLFGLSFLGLFDIVLPHRWVNAMDKKATKSKGFLGVFFMALTLVLVTFSCTGPIIGSILVSAAGGAILKPVVGTLGYSLAFALPFAFFAFFPSRLAALPKSGGWLNTVKVSLGFLELAFALKFLSIADQSYHWGLLDREVYLSIWIAIFAIWGAYLLGKVRMPKDSVLENGKVGVGRVVMAMAIFSFVVYLFPGMFGAPLKTLAGYLPPQSSLDFDLYSATSVKEEQGLSSAYEKCEEPLYADFLTLPHALHGYFDYAQALSCARAQNKPLFIDFTGHGCVNCREMEARVWADSRVLQRLRAHFVVAALYVDDKTLLPEERWYPSSYDNKMKKTIGQQNADIQITRFNNNAQPFYIILGKEEALLAPPFSYDLSVERFLAFLDEAHNAYVQEGVISSLGE